MDREELASRFENVLGPHVAAAKLTEVREALIDSKSP